MKQGWFFLAWLDFSFFFFGAASRNDAVRSEIKQRFALEGIWDILDAELLRPFD